MLSTIECQLVSAGKVRNICNSCLGHTRPSEIWTPAIAKARYESLLRKYKEVKKDFLNHGGPKFCLTDKEMAAGLTIKAKLDKLCPLYDRWDNLYGSRQNINPSNTVDSEDLDDEDANVPDDVNHEDFTQETFLGEAHGEEMFTLRMVDDDEAATIWSFIFLKSFLVLTWVGIPFKMPHRPFKTPFTCSILTLAEENNSLNILFSGESACG